MGWECLEPLGVTKEYRAYWLLPIPVAVGQGGVHAGLPSPVGTAAAGPAGQRAAAAPSAEAAAGIGSVAEVGPQRRRLREVLVRGGDIQVHFEARSQGGQSTDRMFFYLLRSR